MSTTSHIARFVAETRLRSMPTACIDIAKKQVIDFVGVTIAGSLEPSVPMALAFLNLAAESVH